MGADVSRVRFDPLRDFAGVVLQQGRLLLDADFNEYVALLDRRLRAETCDLTSFGPDPDHAGVAWVPRQTPDGFQRHGLRRRAHDRPRPHVRRRAARREPRRRRRSASTRCSRSAPARPTRRTRSSRTGRRPTRCRRAAPHLAYLDVWEREVTYLEDPDLVEVAVGVDTTARTQTAWQVRLLPNIGNATCASDDDEIPGWLDVIAPVGRPADDRHDRGRAPTTTRASCRRAAATAGSRTRPTASRSTTGGAPGHGDVQVVARQRLGRDPRRRDGLDDRAPARVGRQGRRAARSRPATGSRSSTTTTSSGRSRARCAR